MKIKSRKKRISEYNDKYRDISDDIVDRLMENLGKNFNEENILKAKKKASHKRDASTVKITFKEIPLQSYRPRSRGGVGMYVPLAAENYNAMDNFLSMLDEQIQVIDTPMYVSIDAYMPMPPKLKPEEVILYETKNERAIGKPDLDNMCKAYLDMIQKHLILDDDLVVSCNLNKYYSLKPRVEMSITYTDEVLTKHLYKTITSRKRYEEVENKVKIKLYEGDDDD